MRKPFVFLLLFLIALGVFFWIYFPALSRYRELKTQEEKLTHDIADLDGRIETLLEERKLLKNDLNYLEKVIREEMGLVKPGEIIYKMIPEALMKKAPPLKEPAAITPVPEITGPMPEAVIQAPKPAPAAPAGAKPEKPAEPPVPAAKA